MAEHRADAGVLDGGRGQVAGEHLVGGLRVVRNAARDGADYRNLIGDLRRAREILAEYDARELGFDDAERAAIFDRRLGLRIPRFLVRNAARKHDLDHALGAAFRPLRSLGLRADNTGASSGREQVRKT